MPLAVNRRRLAAAGAVVAVATALPAAGVTPLGRASMAAAQAATWNATWTTGLIAPTDRNAAASGDVAGFDRQTFRQVVHVSAGGSRVRLRFSNAFGHSALTIGAVSVAARQLGAAVVALTAVRFHGGASVSIPPGAVATSDGVSFSLDPGANLSVSMFFPRPTGRLAWHQLALATSYATARGSGDHSGDESGAAFGMISRHWYVLSGIDVLEPPGHATVVAFGDSITDGLGSTRDQNQRWPDLLATRLEQAGYPLAVVDAGIGGNRILSDDSNVGGPSGISRLRRDAIDQPGARAMILLEGINDIFRGATAAAIITGLRRAVSAAHNAGVRVLGGTLTPVCRSGPRETSRLVVNAFVRSAGAFDGVVDFAQAVENPASPACLLPRFDSGDHVHLTDAGYAAMAAAVDLGGLDRAARAGTPAPPAAALLAPAVALLLIAAGTGSLVVLGRRRAVRPRPG